MKLPFIPQYEVREYNDKYFNQVQTLFSMAYGGRTISKDSWQWQFYHNPCKNKCITTLWDKDVLVAVTALTPAFCHIDGHIATSACSGTTMARNDYAGVSIQLFRECAIQNEDISAIYGFPNKNSFPIIKYIGHHLCGDICFWTIKPEKCTVNENVNRISGFSNEHERLYEFLISKCSYIRDRNLDYLNWRFVERPGIEYNIVEFKSPEGPLGYMVYNYYYENGEKHLQIIDIISNTHGIFEALIDYAINTAYDNHADLVKFWMSFKEYATLLYNRGFEYGKQPFKCEFWDRDMVLDNCYFTMSDSDIF